MPAQRLPMRQVREVLRLKYAAGYSVRRISEAIGISHSTVGEYLRRAAGDCPEFRVGAVTMALKETSYATTQSSGDPG
jgi:DNA-directed RNA polymerase specialized sigma24 family protein